MPSVAVAIFEVGHSISSAIAEQSVWHTCGLFIKDGNGIGLADLAVHVGGDSSYNYVYVTDSTGFARITSTGYTNGCPAGRNLEIAAYVMINNTQYGAYLMQDQNVTLRL